ncbi:MAG TPA: hypothetical protein VI365_29720 [Trebonia sp.]
MSTGTERTGFESAGIEQRLKAQIDRYPIRLRPELAREAYRAHRRHRLIRRSATAATLAVVVAAGAAVAAGAVPFSSAAQRPSPATSQAAPATGHGTVPPASFQPSPAPDSLSPQQAAKDIFFLRATTSGTGRSVDTFIDGASNRTIAYAAGAPADDGSMVAGTAKDGKSMTTLTDVYYSSQSWLRSIEIPAQPASAPGLCGDAQLGELNSEDPSLLMKGASALLTCPRLKVTRGQQVDGIDAIKISLDDSTLWLNATTDLPIQSQVVSRAAPTEFTQYGYLPATPANLVHYLNAVVPAGFRLAFIPETEPGTTVVLPPWTPPAGAIPPFGLRPVPAGNSLTAAEAKGDILWVRSTTEAVPASDTLLDNIFNYRSASSDLTYYPDGKPWDEDSEAVFRAANGSLTSTHTVTRYDNRTYSVQTSQGGDNTVHVPVASCENGLNLDFQVVPDAARALLNCNGKDGLTVRRGQQIDGISAITIAAKGGQTLWINATTYLPIQQVIVSPKDQEPPAGFNSAPSPGTIQQFTYLPPTPTNLSYLVSPIPAGFTNH